jgi:uncharacterized membrane protein
MLVKILLGALMFGVVSEVDAAQARGVTVINRSAGAIGVIGMVQDPAERSGYKKTVDMPLDPNSQVVLDGLITRVVIKQAPSSVKILGSCNNLRPTDVVTINADSTVTFPQDLVAANNGATAKTSATDVSPIVVSQPVVIQPQVGQQPVVGVQPVIPVQPVASQPASPAVQARGVTVINRSAGAIGVMGMVQDPAERGGYRKTTDMPLDPNSQVVLEGLITRVVIKQAPPSVRILGSCNNLRPTDVVTINADSTVTFPQDVVAANNGATAQNRTAFFGAISGQQQATRAAQDQAAQDTTRQQANAAIVAQGGVLSGGKIKLKAPHGPFDLIITRIQSATNAADDGIRIGDTVSLSDAQGIWSSKNPESLEKNASSSGQNDEHFTLRWFGEIPNPARLLMSGDTNVNFLAVKTNFYMSHQPWGLMQINRLFSINRSNVNSLLWEQFGIERLN